MEPSVPDEDTHYAEPDDPSHYFQMAVLLMLHRQYEVLLRIARNTGTPPDALKEMVQKHRENDYDVPFEW